MALISPDDFEHLASGLQSVATIISFVVAGIWVYQRYIREQEMYPHIESSADINIIDKQGECWIVELIGILDNKGRTQHKIEDFDFDLNAIYEGESVETSHEWGGQVHFPHSIIRGSFLPARSRFFFIDPGVEAKYSFIRKVPSNASFLLFHCWFNYADSRGFSHTAEKTVSMRRDINSELGSAVRSN